ncbi:uncharacterized protein Socs36E isoform X2 [Atheta coriaria]
MDSLPSPSSGGDAAAGTAGKCTCDTIESDCSLTESPASGNNCCNGAKEGKEKKKLSLTSLGFNLRRGRSLQFKTKRTKKTTHCANGTTSSTPSASESGTSSTTPTTSGSGGGMLKKSPKWPLKFSCTKRDREREREREAKNVATAPDAPSCCRCMCYRRTEEHHLGAGVVFDSEDKTAKVSNVSNESDDVEAGGRRWIIEDYGNEESPPQQDIQPIIREVPVNANSIYGHNRAPILVGPMQIPIDVNWMRTNHEDCDEAARRQRAKEMEQGVDPPANFRSTRRVQLLCSDMESTEEGVTPRRLQLVCPSDLSVDSLRALFQNHVMLRSCPLDVAPGCHTQVDFIHCLVPDLLSITNCSFYWGKMDRYEAERLLDGKPEGTFLLRDSAQEEFLFSVSFRKYGRSLHARIEQWNHMFSFDSHDPGVYTSDTVCGLIEHYKDPSSCMFFEPMLTWPLHRKTVFSLQHLCRAVITNSMTYDNVNKLQLPKTLKSYLKEYHYRQKVRVERFDDDVQWLDLLNVQLP